MAAPIYRAIIQHPFNQELMKGTLAQEKFIYYIEQDTLFLKDLSTCFKLIASKIRPEYSSTFLQYADTADKVSEEIVRRYFKEERDIENDGRLSRATLSYTSYLMRMAAVESVRVPRHTGSRSWRRFG